MPLHIPDWVQKNIDKVEEETKEHRPFIGRLGRGEEHESKISIYYTSDDERITFEIRNLKTKGEQLFQPYARHSKFVNEIIKRFNGDGNESNADNGS